MNILVTGGAGFIGSYVVDRCIQRGHDVSILDNLSGTEGKKPDYVNPRARFTLGDVRDLGLVKKLVGECGVVIHNAAAVGIAKSNYEIIRFTEANCLGTANVLQAIADLEKRPRLIVPASNTTYGEGLYSCDTHGSFHPSIRTREDVERFGFDPVCPQCKHAGRPIPTPKSTSLDCNSVYALTKKHQEETALLLGRLFDFPVVCLKYFNVFGPRQSLSNPYTGVSAIFMSRIKAGNTPVVYEDGNQTRDFVSVHDVASANILAIEKPEAAGNVLNIGLGMPITLKDLALKICELHGREPTCDITKNFRRGDIRHCIADNSKARKLLGWEPKVSLSDGLKEVYEWARTQKSRDNFDDAHRELREKGLV